VTVEPGIAKNEDVKSSLFYAEFHYTIYDRGAERAVLLVSASIPTAVASVKENGQLVESVFAPLGMENGVFTCLVSAASAGLRFTNNFGTLSATIVYSAGLVTVYLWQPGVLVISNGKYDFPALFYAHK